MDKQTWQRHFTPKPVSRSRTKQSSNNPRRPIQKEQVKDGKVSSSKNKSPLASANGSKSTDKEVLWAQKTSNMKPRKGGTDRQQILAELQFILKKLGGII
jgi:hypothetical protein